VKIFAPSIDNFRSTVVLSDVTGLDLSTWERNAARRIAGTVAEQICLAMWRLRYLDLSGVPIGNDVKVIAADPQATPLEALRLANCDITDRGVRAIVDVKHWTKLRKLAIGATARTDTWRRLVDAAWLPQLTVLVLDRCMIPGDVLGAILERATSLRCFGMLGVSVLVDVLVTSPIADQLEQLAVPAMLAGELRNLVDAHWPSLHTLELGHLDSEAVRIITERKGMPVVHRIMPRTPICNAWFTDEAL